MPKVEKKPKSARGSASDAPYSTAVKSPQTACERSTIDVQDTISNYSKPYRGLPLEIRQEIWRHCIGEITVIDRVAEMLAKETTSALDKTWSWNEFPLKSAQLHEFGIDTSELYLIKGPSLFAVNTQVREESLHIRHQLRYSLNLAYVHIRTSGGPSVPNYCDQKGRISKHRPWLPLHHLLDGFSATVLNNITTIDYRPLRDDSAYNSACAILDLVGSASPHPRLLPNLKTINYIIDFKDIIKFKSDKRWFNARPHGKRFSTTRPMLFWQDNMRFLSRGKTPIHGFRASPDRMIASRASIDRFAIQLLNVPNSEKSPVENTPFARDFHNYDYADGVDAEITWEQAETGHWKAQYSVTIKKDFDQQASATG